LAWFDAVLANDNAHHPGMGPVVQARALADKALLDAWVGTSYSLDQAEQALAIARECGDPALVARALTACGTSSAYAVEVARPFLAEAIGVARALGDRWRLSQILGWQAFIAIAGAGDPVTVRAAGEEGRDPADAIGDRFTSRMCRWCLAMAQFLSGDVPEPRPATAS
jgi:hypothetical protein